MMYAQYCRLESKAGGVSCTPREFIRACLSVLKKKSRYSRTFRHQRHQWIRSGLAMRLDARQQYHDVMSGNLHSHRSQST